ncbi:MAG: hypothetical protein ACOC2M_00515 [bacterium]
MNKKTIIGILFLFALTTGAYIIEGSGGQDSADLQDMCLSVYPEDECTLEKIEAYYAENPIGFSNEERISALESKISELEYRIIQLEGTT